MAFSRTLIRTMAMSGRGPAAVLMRANHLIITDSRTDVYLTAVYAVLELATGRLVYANAGHCRPMLYRAADATVSELNAPGVLLGAFDTIHLTEARVDLKPGDVVLFYTDGITDALGEDGEMFGDERLAGVLMDAAGGSAEEVLDSVLGAVGAFGGTAEQTDDITCVVVKRN
jgi:sigma-B regulation protein RsbU (phosphoserine phosphatase)